MDWLTKEDIKRKYRHVSMHEMPFETKVLEVIPQEGTVYSNRWEFLKGLFFIVEDNYYFTYNDVCLNRIELQQEGQPYDIFLDGALRCTYPHAFSSSSSSTVNFVKSILSKGKIYINRNKKNRITFTFVNDGFSYLRNYSGSKNSDKGDNSNNGNDKLKIEYITHSRYYKKEDLIPQSNSTCTPLHLSTCKKLNFYDSVSEDDGFHGNVKVRVPDGFENPVAKKDGMFFLLNPDTFEPIPNIEFEGYNYPLKHDKYVIWLRINNKWGLYNRTLERFVIPPICDNYEYFRYISPLNIFKIKVFGKYGVANDDGKIILEASYDYIGFITMKRFKVKKNNDEWEVSILV